MAYPKVKGSIVLKVLVVAAAVLLFFAIYIPNTIWNLEEAEERECHFRMIALTDVQDLYYNLYNGVYADSLEKLIRLVDQFPEFRASADSAIQVRHDETMAELARTGETPRLYSDVPITVDSVFHCPTTGENYIINLNSNTKYFINCPVNEGFKTVYYFFKKSLHNHGNVDEQKNGSWQ